MTANIPHWLRRGRALLALCVLFGPASPALAQILIGQTSGFTGSVAVGVKENTDGAKLYFDHVNASGGINGQSIELISLDDKFDPATAKENARKLIERGVIALFLNRGTPHSEAIRPLLDEFQVPLVAPSTGAMVLHKPVHPWIFNVRSTYQREAQKAVEHLVTIGLTRIGLVHVDDSFGADAATGAEGAFAKAKLEPVLRAKFDRAKPVFDTIVAGLVKADAQAVLMFGSAGTVADATQALRKAGSHAQVVTLSNNASSGFIKLLGEHARGTIVSQVFPSVRKVALPLVKEAADLAKAKGMDGITPAMMEGFAAAKVLAEGLRRAGPKPTRERLAAALNGMGSYDLGGMRLGYSPSDHSGLDYTELSIIGADGRFMR
jgi:ABC-type branched-subunit amino acid transport system substrate-binding protein